MLSVIAYGRLVSRTLFSFVTQTSEACSESPSGTGWPWINRRLLGTQPATPVQSACDHYRLISAVSGFSKLDRPAFISTPTPSSVFLDKCLFGDDAYFISKHKTTDVLGVADGVGGWRHYGVDPSQFSRQLMESCKMLVETGKFNTAMPTELLATGFQAMEENKIPLVGSCTACIVMVDRLKQTLHATNLGDSGFMVVRKGEVIHRSTDQQHFFNTPYQLSIPPENQRGSVLSDSANDAVTSSCDIELGDIILTATDGLFDNIPDYLILKELSRIRDSTFETVHKSASNIAHQAHKFAHDPEYLSPFAKNARDNGYNITGGKPDDITILLSLVVGE